MKKNLLSFAYLLFIFIGCTQKEESDLPEPAIYNYPDSSISFEFKKDNNSEGLKNDITLQVAYNEITGFIPYLLTTDSLVATFTLPEGCWATVNEVVQVSGVTKNNFNQPVIYTIKTPTGAVKQYTFKLSSFTTLPILYIRTENQQAIESKEVYLNADLAINGNAQYTQGLYNGKIQIRGRGNTTWDMPKQPYKIKLNQKAPLLDMPADKEWVLLANYADKTLIRNYAAFELSRRLGLKYTPRSRFVEVVLNNEYIGNYLLTEQIKIAENRVDIKELESSDISSDKISGGYLLEIDVRLDAESWFRTEKGVPFCIKSPNNIAPKQFEYIKNYVQQTEDVLYSDSFADPVEGYAKYINVNSFVNWYLLNEITKNTDALFHTSVFMYKDRNGKLCLGPAWDYDIGFGNVNYGGNDFPEGFYIQHSVWINRLFQDPTFYNQVKQRFNLLKETELKTLSQYINQTATRLNKSQAENFKKWEILEYYVWPNAVVLDTYENEVNYLTDWLDRRLAWMDNELNQSR